MLERWQAQIEADPDPVIDVDAAMMQVTLEVVGKALFGIDLSREARSLTAAVLTCLDHIIYKARQMIVPPDWVPTPRNLRFRGALRRLDEAVYGLIDARRRKRRARQRSAGYAPAGARPARPGSP